MRTAAHVLFAIHADELPHQCWATPKILYKRHTHTHTENSLVYIQQLYKHTYLWVVVVVVVMAHAVSIWCVVVVHKTRT